MSESEIQQEVEEKDTTVSKDPEKEVSKTEKEISTKTNTDQLAIVRIRGGININKPIKDSLDMLRLYNQHTCSVYDKCPSILGMLQKVKDYVTWGEINGETIKLLDEKRKIKEKKFYRLHPPRGGFERKGIKKSFKIGGALGYRGEKINILIKKMI